MHTKFFTNEQGNTLLKRFAGVFEHLPNIAFFDALVGYFRASGYFAIRPYLEKVPHIRILVGINVDKIVAHYHTQGLLFKSDPQMAVEDFRQAMKTDIQSASYTKETEHGILQFIDDVASGKVQIKAHPHRKLHAKIYIFRPEHFNEYFSGEVITGSSNLTAPGLGNSESSNYEFNVALRDYEDVKFAAEEFEKLWNEGVDVLPVDVRNVATRTYLNETFTPYEIYLKFLIEYFGKNVEFDPNNIGDLPNGFKRLSYQIDAVEQGFELLKKHNGFFLADVVGLGKTVVGALIAKKFFYYNDFPSHISTTLIVTPPAIRPYWRETLDKFGLKNYEIINNGSLHTITHPEKYDLILVDEAHKFRNDTSDAYNALQKLCKSPSSRRLKDGVKAPKKVVLISATPLNNRPADIRNLVLLFQDGKRSTLPGESNLISFFADITEAYQDAQKAPLEEARAKVAELYQNVREKIITPLTIRRTRTDLLEHEEYKEDLTAQGIIFPHIAPPCHILYELEPALEQLYDDTMIALSSPPEQGGLTYFRYQALRYLVADKKGRYHNAELASRQLAFMMKTLLVKRLDSSFTAFRASLQRFSNATIAMMTMFRNGKIYIAPNLNVSEYILEDKEDELLDKISSLMDTDPSIMICTPEDFEPEFLEGLRQDDETLRGLMERWDAVTDDPKFETFARELQNALFDPARNPQQKLVVFSESQETTAYLVKRLKASGRDDVVEIHAGNRKEKMPAIRANFDANLPHNQWKNDINIVITTEVLAEGVNLHRANIIVNYDTPWNSTRLMQRIGRVNRIGSPAGNIYIYNFYPTAKVDNDIELRKKAIMKLQAFHSALGEDSQIYSTEEEVGTFGLFEKSPEESRDERLAYLMELRKFKRENPQEFLRIRNMPLRARTGRKNHLLAGGTLTFIKSPKRDAFSFVSKSGELLELTFIEAAKEFKAAASEKSAPLHDQHHAHVNQAVSAFHAQIEAERRQEIIVDTSLSPHDRKALALLASLLNAPEISDEQQALIKAAQTAIKVHTYNQLSKKLAQFADSTKKTPMRIDVMLEKLFAILESFPLSGAESVESPGALMFPSSQRQEHPEIIISESFITA